MKWLQSHRQEEKKGRTLLNGVILGTFWVNCRQHVHSRQTLKLLVAFMPNVTVIDQKMHPVLVKCNNKQTNRKKGASLLKSGLLDVTTPSTLSPYLSLPMLCLHVCGCTHSYGLFPVCINAHIILKYTHNTCTWAGVFHSLACSRQYMCRYI